MTSSLKLSEGCGVCLAPGDSVNHLDHLAPLSFLMGMPLVVDVELLTETMETYYPQVEALYIDHHAKILEYFAHNHDFLFVSSANYRKDLSPLFEVIFRKQMQFWYCPHGNSDKSIDTFKDQHYFFTYGPLMEERLKESGLLDAAKGYVRTGNYRFPFYQMHEAYYDALVEKEVFSQFAKKQPTILYAPTWQDLESSSSFTDVGLLVPEQVPDSYNLIVKLHPWLIHYKSGYVMHLEERYRDASNVAILSQYPLVLPLLKQTDIYLGDFSSIGYDFLYYNRPMFFFEGSDWKGPKEYSSYLHQCGAVIPPSAYETVFPFIEKHLASQDALQPVRYEIYQKAFGEKRSFEAIKEEVYQVLDQHSTAK